MHNVSVVLSVPELAQFTCWVREFVEPVGKRAIAGGHGSGPPRPPEVTQPIDQDRPQPGAKRTRLRIAMKLRELTDEHGEHLLHKIIGVAVLQFIATKPAMEK